MLLAAALLGATNAAAQGDLRGSRASLEKQNRIARAHDYTYLRTPAQVRHFASRGWLVPVRPNRDFALAGVSFPYARPEVRLFVRRLGQQHRAACGEQLVVTSLTRPTTRQPRNASDISVHPTGMALDLRYSRNVRCRRWLEGVLLSLERAGVLDVTLERRPVHYHVALFPKQYAAYVDRVNRDDEPTLVAQAPAPPPARPTRPAEPEAPAPDEIAVAELEPAPATAEGTELASADPAGTAAEESTPATEVLVAEAPEPTPTAAQVEIPAAETPDAEIAATEAPDAEAPDAEQDAQTLFAYRVRRGDSLWTIARAHGVSVRELRRTNGLRNNRIYEGQVLSLNAAGSIPAANDEESQQILTAAYRVQRGDSLWSIAQSHGVSVRELRRANGLRGSRLYPGQRLALNTSAAPAPAEEPVAYEVRRGDSLWSIAQSHGVSVRELRRANGLRSSRLYPGQRLSVPSGS